MVAVTGFYRALYIILAALALAAVSILVTGCASASRPVAFGRLYRPASARIAGLTLTVDIPENRFIGDYYIHVAPERGGDDVVLRSKVSYIRVRRYQVFDLATLGFTPDEAAAAEVYWLEPDGSRVRLNVEGRER